MEKRNTFAMGNERIWLRLNVRIIHLGARSSNIECVIAILQETLKTAKEQGFEDVTVFPEYEDYRDEEDRVPQGLMVVNGWRLETDQEYKQRLDNLLWEIKRNKEVWQQRQTYFESGQYAKRVTDLENAIEELRLRQALG